MSTDNDLDPPDIITIDAEVVEEEPEEYAEPVMPPTQPARFALLIAFAAALAGLFFAATSTADFTAHLDRQVHAIQCSVMPGATADLGESGCRTAMLSQYSSWFRTDYWGGIPISLWALAVFAFLAYRSGHLLFRGHPRKSEAIFLLLASLVPCAASIYYGRLAQQELGEWCTVCVGMYTASGGFLLASLLALILTNRPTDEHGDGGVGRFFMGVIEGCAFVGIFSLVYITAIPQVAADNQTIRGSQGCGILAQPEDPARIMLNIGPATQGTDAIALIDPLCPACRAFDERLHSSGLASRLNQDLVLFPLDSKCNWMVSTSLHPGACLVSETMLCAPRQASEILAWAFENQEELTELGDTDEKALIEKLKTQFPAAAKCIGTPIAKNKIVKSLRWAVANALTVMTPQLFISGRRLCDEDTDLGLQYTLTRMLGDVK